jgi:transposase
MIGSTRSLRVWAYPGPTDLRRSYNGLSGMVLMGLGMDPLSGDCFLFTNKTRRLAKVLMWDGTGLCIFQKRLEEGRFACLWRQDVGEPVTLTMSELALFIEGSQLVGKTSISPPEFTPKVPA